MRGEGILIDFDEPAAVERRLDVVMDCLIDLVPRLKAPVGVERE